MSTANSTWTDWTGRPARKKGTLGNQYTRVIAPEWAYCTAERFVQLLMKADAEGVTLEKMQGGWDYPALDDDSE